MSPEKYYAGKDGIAPRPNCSPLELVKDHGTGFEPRDQLSALREQLLA